MKTLSFFRVVTDSKNKKYLPLAKNHGGWSLLEMMIVITIMIALAILGYIGYNAEGTNDPARMKAIGTTKAKIEAAMREKLNGENPSSSPQSEDYPSECRTSSYKLIVDNCLTKVLASSFSKDNPDYKIMIKDPSQGKQVSGETFKYYYCPSTNPDHPGFRIIALAGDQDKKGLVGKDGSATPAQGKGYLKVDSGVNIVNTDVSTCYE